MKKIALFFIMTLFLLTGCGSKLTTYKEISYDEYTDMIEQKDSFILFIGSNECSHCNAYKEKVNKIISEYQTMIYYIDVNKFTSEQTSSFKASINFSATPTTVFIENGKEKTDSNGNVGVYRINGNLEYSKVVEKIKKAGFIKD